LVDAVLHAQRGILQPQLIPAAQIQQIIKGSQNDFPTDQSFPLSMSSEYSFQLFNIIDFDVLIQDTYFVYVIKLPLSSFLSCDVYRVHAFPNRINGTTAKSTFIQPEKEFVLIDKTKAILHPLL
jgi:hypothetical protein